MVIKIVKKRHVPEMREAAPLVEPSKPAGAPLASTAPKQPKIGQPLTKTVVVACSFCGHGYITPCHGKSDSCMNRKFLLDAGKTGGAHV